MSKKKKSNKKQTSKSPSKKKATKGLVKKQTTSKSVKGKKPVKSKKTTKKRAKSVSKKKAQSILSSKRWKTTRSKTGKLVKGAKRKKKLTRTQDKNRYQTIIKTLSDYYKKAGLNYYICGMKKKLIWIGVFIILWCIVLIFRDIEPKPIQIKQDQDNIQIEEELLKEMEVYWNDVESEREMDSIDDYMRYWYEVLDTNSDGDIDDTEIYRDSAQKYTGEDENKHTSDWSGTTQGE